MRMAGRLAVSFSLERNRTTGIIILKGGFCGPRNVDGLRSQRRREQKCSLESCVLLVLRNNCAGASIGDSKGGYSVKLLGTGLLAVSFSKEKETARRPTMQIFLSETYRFQKMRMAHACNRLMIFP